MLCQGIIALLIAALFYKLIPKIAANHGDKVQV